jgi:hypothetical protein
MILHVPCNITGTVKQITPKGVSSEAILALEDPPPLEITVHRSTTATAGLTLKKNDPAYTTIFWLKGAIPPGSEKEMVTTTGVSPGPDAWPVPVNLYRGLEKMSEARVAGIKR